MSKTPRPLHPELATGAFDGLFNVGKTELDNLIGKRVFVRRAPENKRDRHVIKLPSGEYVRRFVTWDNKAQKFGYHNRPEMSVVGSVQKLYDGSYGLRVYAEGDTFGAAVRLSDIIMALDVVK